MSRLRERWDTCVACGVEHFCEYDHFPVPHRCGGTDVVPLCESCHTLKDRMLAEDWPISVYAGAIGQMFGSLGREGRLLMMKMLSYAMEGHEDHMLLLRHSRECESMAAVMHGKARKPRSRAKRHRKRIPMNPISIPNVAQAGCEEGSE